MRRSGQYTYGLVDCRHQLTAEHRVDLGLAMVSLIVGVVLTASAAVHDSLDASRHIVIKRNRTEGIKHCDVDFFSYFWGQRALGQGPPRNISVAIFVFANLGVQIHEARAVIGIVVIRLKHVACLRAIHMALNVDHPYMAPVRALSPLEVAGSCEEDDISCVHLINYFVQLDIVARADHPKADTNVVHAEAIVRTARLAPVLPILRATQFLHWS